MALTNFNIDNIIFGRYKGIDIEWTVLEKSENRLLIISTYGFCGVPFCSDAEPSTWESSWLRTWLNEEFYHEAFSEDERKRVILTNVDADRNPYYSSDPGSSTKDKIFVLSINEANTYYNSSESRKLKPVKYAEGYVSTDDEGFSCWVLRTPGEDNSSVAWVDFDGTIDSRGWYVDIDYYCVRPALWIYS